MPARTAKGWTCSKGAEATITESSVGDGETTYKLAQAYAALGDKTLALSALDRSIDQGFFCYRYFAGDSLLKNLRGEPGFQTALEKARNRYEAFAHTQGR